VATLYGSRTAGYWTSLAWASVTTLAGSLCSVYLAQALLKAFTGAGLVPTGIAGQAEFAMAVAGGAALTVALASWRGLPISTTHALVGAMSGAGLVAVGMGVHFDSLGKSFLLPLLASPLIAIIPAWLIAPLLRRLVVRAEQQRVDCLCIEQAAMATPDGVMMREAAVLRTGSMTACVDSDARPLLRFDAARMVHALHFLFAGAVGFARGLNDTPKIAALLLPIAMLDSNTAVRAAGGAHHEHRDHRAGSGCIASRQSHHQPAGQYRQLQRLAGIDHACRGRCADRCRRQRQGWSESQGGRHDCLVVGGDLAGRRVVRRAALRRASLNEPRPEGSAQLAGP
jgi:phosphate/sulfate permease